MNQVAPHLPGEEKCAVEIALHTSNYMEDAKLIGLPYSLTQGSRCR